uniref:Uncharacterized protein n=1 Tax=Trichogramma kaykai TaxID=54128 RepID=A0ABD2WH44_9HYME
MEKSTVKFAIVVCEDDKRKQYCKSIEVIYESKKRNINHIQPQNVNDFKRGHMYSIYWSSCNKNCTRKDGCCSSYNCQILGLGETEKQAWENSNNKIKRLKWKKKFESSDFTDTNDEIKENINEKKIEENNKKTIEYSKSIRAKNIIEKFKANEFLNKRTPLVDKVINNTKYDLPLPECTVTLKPLTIPSETPSRSNDGQSSSKDQSRFSDRRSLSRTESNHRVPSSKALGRSSGRRSPFRSRSNLRSSPSQAQGPSRGRRFLSQSPSKRRRPSPKTRGWLKNAEFHYQDQENFNGMESLSLTEKYFNSTETTSQALNTSNGKESSFEGQEDSNDKESLSHAQKNSNESPSQAEDNSNGKKSLSLAQKISNESPSEGQGDYNDKESLSHAPKIFNESPSQAQENMNGSEATPQLEENYNGKESLFHAQKISKEFPSQVQENFNGPEATPQAQENSSFPESTFDGLRNSNSTLSQALSNLDQESTPFKDNFDDRISHARRSRSRSTLRRRSYSNSSGRSDSRRSRSRSNRRRRSYSNSSGRSDSRRTRSQSNRRRRSYSNSSGRSDSRRSRPRSNHDPIQTLQVILILDEHDLRLTVEDPIQTLRVVLILDELDLGLTEDDPIQTLRVVLILDELDLGLTVDDLIQILRVVLTLEDRNLGLDQLIMRGWRINCSKLKMMLFYLGQNVFIGEKSWNYARSKNHTRFLRCVAIALWGGRKVIANRCLLPRGQTIVFPDKGPSKLMSAKKVELLLSLLEDYIHDKMPDITESG